MSWRIAPASCSITSSQLPISLLEARSGLWNLWNKLKSQQLRFEDYYFEGPLTRAPEILMRDDETMYSTTRRLKGQMNDERMSGGQLGDAEGQNVVVYELSSQTLLLWNHDESPGVASEDQLGNARVVTLPRFVEHQQIKCCQATTLKGKWLAGLLISAPRL
ncbi:predicted protein [Histoplasma capsulatum var. duboisii H88]|uniref:Predicted protein n=2 Tax=Ajellomyces capsulatus TaxID=5037 RepID=F0UL54_AJEC8|nr:predicted protein [Histoplasma capsulatum H143]EGC46158.1 predicted protein [Histoplasma capsulatum var. duboisii H88]